ncbi:hypothetical protein ONS95_002020 [Cadophora gregata]|uniref:uncharacterized protein n=1 Tax=Cadophora gregata TaxID=51156 RepID=UPI0026DA9718|nr:uncharacterized protein ONS95_002020 [Cadophora gregata]KAK0111675.1 hypothetical protein ONS95_002020 [Cadophora gregata]
MKTSTLLTTVFGLALASAQNLSGQPACATPCLASAIAAAGCPLTDQGCQCGTGKPAIQAVVATCLVANCNASDLAAAASIGNDLCVAYSATAPPGTTTDGSALTTQTSAGGPEVSGSTSAPQTTGTSTSGGVSAATTSPATTSPPRSSSASRSGSRSGTGAAQGTSSTSSAGAAQGVVAGAGGVVGLLLGLVAAL